MTIPYALEAQNFMQLLTDPEQPISVVLPGNHGWEQVLEFRTDEIGFPIVVTERGEQYILPQVLLQLPHILG